MVLRGLKNYQVEFEVGDMVFLSPRFVGPFEILKRIGKVAYKLALSPTLAGVHNMFHVSCFHAKEVHPGSFTCFDQLLFIAFSTASR